MMSEKDYSPLSPACVRALQDKLYDKRKAAALEIEKMVREFALVNNTSQIKRILKVLGQNFAASHNVHAKKGGLIGLAAVAIALGKDTSNYTSDLINPILACFSDADSRVRYYACESLYNVIKVARGSVLPHFGDIFNALSKIATDSEQSVKNASELLDRLMKDIVTDSPSFDLEAFMPLLRERIYPKCPFACQFIISWISILDAVPDIDLILYLPELLDGLFKILGDPNKEVKKSCEITLGEFLRSIKQDPSRVDFGGMINTLISHAQDKNDDMVQFTAIIWIKEFVQLSGPLMLPHLSGIFTAILPCLAYDSDSCRITDIKETASAINFALMKLISLEENNIVIGEEKQKNYVNLLLVVDCLTQYLMYNSVPTKVAVLRWILHLYLKIPLHMASYIDKLFPALQKTLSDSSDEVVQQCLAVIAKVISSTYEPNVSRIEGDMSPYYSKFLISLLQLFNSDKQLLENRGSFIIRQLCVLLNSEDIYKTLAEILLEETDLKFASLMVEQLNVILLTSSELYELRTSLKDLNSRESWELFNCLYNTWCHNPVATISLCLLSQCYSHTCNLIRHFGNLEVTVDFLTEIDKLVQLIESPIFAYLRLELLEVPCDQNLVRALYGLLMLLPQTGAFQILRTRLSCIPSLNLNVSNAAEVQTKDVTYKVKSIDFSKKLQHFIDVQDKHKEYKKLMRTKELSNVRDNMKNVNI